MPTSIVNYRVPANLGPGQHPFKIPTNRVIKKLLLSGDFGASGVLPTRAQWPTYISHIELKIRGRRAWNISMQDYVNALEYEGIETVPGVLPILFDAPNEEGPVMRSEWQLGTADLGENDLQLILTFTAEPINVFRISGETTIGANVPVGRIISYVSRDITGTQNGSFPIDVIASGPGRNYQIAQIFIDTDKIDDVEVLFGQQVYDETTKNERELLAVVNGRSDLAGYTVIDFIRGDAVANALSMGVGPHIADGQFNILAKATEQLSGFRLISRYVQDWTAEQSSLA